MSYSAEAVIEKAETSFKDLIQDLNRTSAVTRNSWIFFMALQAYFFIGLAGVTHRDLLLNTPVTLPLLHVEISLRSFFVFGPVILVLIHLGVLLQHVMLARQARETHSRIARFEGRGLFREHYTRLHVHSYFYTQMLAGPKRSKFFAFFLGLMTWLTLAILPAILLLNFQVTFLPYHDVGVTMAHRFYLVIDIVVLTLFSVFMHYPVLPFVSGFGRMIVDGPFRFLVSLMLCTGALFLSISIATIPDETMDRFMTSIWSSPVPTHETDQLEPRFAFWPTAYLFEGRVDLLSGRTTSLFARNLVVTDADLVPDNGLAPDDVSISLRRRDLRYGTFDRSDWHQADLTGAVLTRASLREINLVEATAEKAIFRGADLWQAKLFPALPDGRAISGVDLRDADLREANLVQANMNGANLQGAQLQGADLQGTSLQSAQLSRANFEGAKVDEGFRPQAEAQGAQF